MTLAGLLIGVCIGAIRGKSRENYRIVRFHDDVEAGRHLVRIDVTGRSRTDVIELINLQSGRVEYRGSDSTFVNPFIRSP